MKRTAYPYVRESPGLDDISFNFLKVVFVNKKHHWKTWDITSQISVNTFFVSYSK